MPKIDVVRRIDQESLSSVLGASSSQSGTGSTISGLIGLKDQSSAAVYGDPYGFVQLIGADSSIFVYRINSTQLGIQANISGLDHNSLGNLDVGDVHTQYASANGIGTRSAYQSERVNKSILTPSGSGLTGGGVLTSDRSISLVLADSGGLEIATNSLQLADTIAGAGLGISSKVLSVNVDRMLTVVSDNVGIGDGATHQFIGTTTGTAAGWKNVSTLAGANMSYSTGTLQVDRASNFTWTGIHTFQTNDVQMHVDLNFNVAHTISTTTGDLTLNPFAAVLVPDAKRIGSPGFAGNTFPIAGWRIGPTAIPGQSGLVIGQIDADELHIRVFVADETRVDRGDEYWTKSYGILAESFIVPAVSSTTTVTFENSPALVGAIFTTGDWLLFRYIDINTGLTVSSAWGQVSGYVDNADAATRDNKIGTQSWTYTHRQGSVGLLIRRGGLGIDFGASGAALIHLSVIDPSGAPYIKMRRWAGADPYSPLNHTTYVQLGKLDGGVGNANYTPTGDGLYVRSTASANTFLVADDLGLQIRNAKFSMYSGVTEVIRLDPSIPSIGLGSTLPTVFNAPGIWMGRHAADSTYRLSINEDGNQYLQWTWDAGAARYRINMAGDIYINNSSGMGGSNAGGTIWMGANGKIDMGDTSTILMGAGSWLNMGVGSKATIGTEGSGHFFGYVDGVMRLEGQIVVTDGGDLISPSYVLQHVDVSFESYDNYAQSRTQFIAAPPYADGNIAGQIETGNGNRYFVGVSSSTYVLRTGSRNVIFWVYKTHPVLGGIDNTDSWSIYSNLIYVYSTLSEEWDVLDQEVKNNRVVLGYGYLGYDIIELVSFSPRSVSGLTIITPNYIKTPHLSALSANLGSVTAGSIVVGSSNKLWLNDDLTHSDIAFAVGGTSKSVAPFRLYEDGRMIVGNVGAAKYMEWDNTNFNVYGGIYATSGTLANLNITGNLNINTGGNLTMNGGKIQWNSTNSYIDNTKIRISDTRSTITIGNTAQLGLGLINIDMLDAGQVGGSWRHGIRIADAGNALANVSSLFHATSSIAGAASVDRLFDARTEAGSGSLSDGFYAEMGASGTWSNFDTVGVPFKGIALTGGPVAMFNQIVGGADAPALWVTSGNGNRSIVISEMGAENQIAFRVIDNGNTGYALWADGQRVHMGDGRLENVNIINFTTSVSGVPPWGPVVNFGGASNRTVVRWLRLEVDGTTYQIPLFANGAFN